MQFVICNYIIFYFICNMCNNIMLYMCNVYMYVGNKVMQSICV